MADALSKDAKKRRKQRHETRKALIVLDYTVETMGGLILLITNVSGTLYQYKSANVIFNYVALCIAVFMYAIPIPLAYLVNESRVRSTILAAGWIEGIRSIFYSSDKIRNLEREKLRENTPNIQNIKGQNNPANSLPNFQMGRTVENMCSDNSTDNHTLNRNTDNDKSSTNNIISRQDVANDNSKSTFESAKEHADFSDEYIEGNLPNHDINHSTSNQNVEIRENEIVVADIEYVNDEMVHSKETTATKRSPKSIIFRQDISNDISKFTLKTAKLSADSGDKYIKSNPDNCDMKQCKNKLDKELKENEIVVLDVEFVDEEMIPPKASASLMVSGTKRVAESKIFPFKLSSSIESAFQEKSGMVLRLLRDENFKSFSREYVLRRMLKGLDDNINEIQYRKYIEHLCYLEDYHQEQRKSCTVPELDFVVALLNAWYLSIWYLHGTTYQPGKVKISTSGKEPPADIKNNKNGRDQQRRRIIKHLLSCVSTDDQYRQYLKSLCIIERNCDQQDIPRCWDASAENDEKLIKPQQKCTIVKCFKR